MATLAEIRTRIAAATGNKTNLDSTIDNNVNEAILQLIFEVRPKEMQTTTTFVTVDGDFDYIIGSGGDIPVTDLYAIEMVRNETQEYRLARGTYSEFEANNQSITGDPNKWIHRSTILILYSNVPDGSADTIKISYLKRPTRLTANSDTFPLNDEWLRPVEVLAVALTFADLQQFDKTSARLAEYQRSLILRETPEAIEDEAPDSRVIPVSNTIMEGDF